jgi:hypothetical protein
MKLKQNSTVASLLIAGLVALAVLAGCGGSNGKSSDNSSSNTGAGAGALAAEAQSTATGDIPDNQVFLTLRNPSGGYSIKYPEGWSQKGSGRDVTFQDKNNLAHIVVVPGSRATPQDVATALSKLKSSNRSFTVDTRPQLVTVSGSRVAKAVYSTRSAPNPVTGKRVTLVVDRYVVSDGKRTATVDLGTPKGVDNVDAYRMMIESFQWR